MVGCVPDGAAAADVDDVVDDVADGVAAAAVAAGVGGVDHVASC